MMNHQGNNFTIFMEDGKYHVKTHICDECGCAAESITFETLEEAKQKAAEMTAEGKQMLPANACESCYQEMMKEAEIDKENNAREFAFLGEED